MTDEKSIIRLADIEPAPVELPKPTGTGHYRYQVKFMVEAVATKVEALDAQIVEAETSLALAEVLAKQIGLMLEPGTEDTPPAEKLLMDLYGKQKVSTAILGRLSRDIQESQVPL